MKSFLAIILLVSVVVLVAAEPPEQQLCTAKNSKCFFKKITCPSQCPTKSPKHPNQKLCHIDCHSPICQAECIDPKPNCHGKGAACKDPRFIGGDGVVFYFHGKKNEPFALVSDPNLQINGHFIGLRPAGRSRDYTWIQALGILFGSHSFSLEATKTATWDDEVDHLRFTYDGEEIVIPEGYPSSWASSGIKVARTLSRNSAIVTIEDVADISINVVPITKEDDRIHNYQIPSDDSFAHLEVQFRFHGLSAGVEGVIGRTYQPDFENPAKVGVAMPVVGGEDRYKTSSLLSADCKSCIFAPEDALQQDKLPVMEYGTLDCSSSASSGNGIVCRK